MIRFNRAVFNCTVKRSSSFGQTSVILPASYNSEYELIFSGRNLPNSIGRSIAVPYFNTFLLIGGRNETSPATSVLKYDGGEEETWTQVATLRSGRMDLTAFLLTFRCGSHTGTERCKFV